MRPLLLPLLLLPLLPLTPTESSAQSATSVPATRGDTAALRQAITRIARESGGRLGVGIELLETRERVLHGEADRYPMQSVYKLPIAMAVMAAVDAGRLRLADSVDVRPAEYVRLGQHSPLRDDNPRGARVTVRELLRLNSVESDGTACDVLLRIVGGAPRVMAFLRGIGVDGVMVRDTEKALGRDYQVQYRNWARPSSALALLRALHEGRGLSDSSRALVLHDIVVTRTGLKRLRGGVPEGTVVAHKTGTGGSRGARTSATNDIGLVTLPDGRQLAVAVFLSDATGDAAAREAVIARVARAAWDAYAPPR